MGQQLHRKGAILEVPPEEATRRQPWKEGGVRVGLLEEAVG